MHMYTYSRIYLPTKIHTQTHILKYASTQAHTHTHTHIHINESVNQ